MLEKEVKIRAFSKQQQALKDGGEAPDQDSSSEASEESQEEDTKSNKKQL
jgi:hypothetical protein